ncbi:MAG: MFS transporter, partial [Paludibacteraceae bacterium]|nr:MFS transporter [Paludibacteraceae bacterium]
MSTKQNKSNVVAIITMFFMFAMISFVTNMAAPFGNIWKTHYEWSGMLGNMMNFAAYLFMGIPAGKLLIKIGYKKTALIALIVGFLGVAVQFCSSFMSVGLAALVVYLLGAFICGFCVCMLNTVVNPMLNTLGGGGNKGNQLIQTGGAMNSLAGTLTPLLAGAMIGTITKETAMSQVRPLLSIALAVFAISFLILYLVAIPEPGQQRQNASKEKDKHSAWSFRH